MNEGMGDKVMSQVEKMASGLTDHLAKQYKNVKPFNKEPVDNKEMLYWYSQLTPDDMQYLIQKHGPETVNEMIYRMETAKSKLPNKGVQNG